MVLQMFIRLQNKSDGSLVQRLKLYVYPIETVSSAEVANSAEIYSSRLSLLVSCQAQSFQLIEETVCKRKFHEKRTFCWWMKVSINVKNYEKLEANRCGKLTWQSRVQKHL